MRKGIRNVLAVAGCVVSLAGAGVAGAGVSHASGSYVQGSVPEYRMLPPWARYQKLSTAECGRDHAAVVVYSTARHGDSAALICRGGKTEAS